MKRKWMKSMMACAVIAGLLTGCGGASGTRSAMRTDTAAENTSTAQGAYDAGIAYDDYAMDSAKAEEIAAEMPEKGSGAQTNQTSEPDNLTLLEEKLVYHCNLDIETLDYPATMTSIKETITKYGGIIQSESESDSGTGWYYENYRKTSATMHNYLEVRIPSEKYDDFLAALDGVGKIISKSTSVDNISQRYYDTTSQIEALKIQEKNLLVMMEKCETIEDMISVENRLSEVQYQLSELQTSRRYMDMDVAYSYVNIGITEVMEYRQDSEPVRKNTFADRLRNTVWSTGKGFLAFLEGLLFLLIHLSPYILITIVICAVFLRKKIRHFIETYKAKKAQKQNNDPKNTTST